MRHAVILAGGTGTRLWPASRRSLPKQLLPFVGSEPMITSTVAIARGIAADRVSIVTAEAQFEATRAVVRDVDLIAEPASRDTAAAIALAGVLIAERDPHATIAFLPADHHVRDPKGMEAALDTCLTAAETTDAIALVGILPTRAETGFGYLEIARSPDDQDGYLEMAPRPRSVRRFVEKPDRQTAERYVASGYHLWNAGIFCLTVSRLLTELDALLPETSRLVRQIVRDNGLVLDPRGLYEQLPFVSFDRGVMEKTDHVVAVSVAVGWNDVGSWSALPEIRGTDASGNTVVGGTLLIDGTGNVVVSDDDTLITAIGVSDLVIVKSGNAILVVRKDQAQRVREVVGALSARKLTRYL